MAIWQLQTAKAKLSELLRAVRDEGPQIISVRGKEAFVVSAKDAGAAIPVRETWDEIYAPVRGLFDDVELPPREVEPERFPNLFRDEK
jgi:prevent-host-death family protein